MLAKKYELVLFKIHLQPPMRKTPMHLSSHRQRVWKKIVRLHELVHGGNQTIPTMAQMEAIVAIVEFNLEKCPNWKIVGAVIFPLKPINAAHQIPNRILSTHVHTLTQLHRTCRTASHVIPETAIAILCFLWWRCWEGFLTSSAPI